MSPIARNALAGWSDVDLLHVPQNLRGNTMTGGLSAAHCEHGYYRGQGCATCAPTVTRRIEARELIATVRRVAKEQSLYRTETILHLNLAAAELERLSYPTGDGEVKS